MAANIQWGTVKNHFVEHGSQPGFAKFNRKIHRFSLLEDKLEIRELAAQAISTFLSNNPSIVFISKPEPNETLAKLLKQYPVLVLNNDVLCLTNDNVPSSSKSAQLIDVYFSGSPIQKPVRCSTGGHIFEKRNIEGWIKEKGDVCPHGGHPIKGNKGVQQEPMQKAEDPRLVELIQVVRQATPKKLIEAIREIPKEKLSAAVQLLNIDPIAVVIRVEKLRNLERHLAQLHTKTMKDQIIDYLRNIETAFAEVLPDHRPSGGYESQQMRQELTVMGAGVVSVGYVAGLWGLGALALAVGGYGYWKVNVDTDLPKEFPPCKNLTEELKYKQYYPLTGRDEVIRQICLCWNSVSIKGREHPLLVGNAGVGKTSIMEEVAFRIATADPRVMLPEALKNCALYSCNAPDLLPSNAYEGDRRFIDFLRRLKKIQDRAVVAIDEVHTFMNAQHAKTYSERIKPMLDQRGPPYMLFATTKEDYEKYIKVENSLDRRFHVIEVESLGHNETVTVVRQLALVEHPSVNVGSDLVEYIVGKGEELNKKLSKYQQPDASKQIFMRAASLVGKRSVALSPLLKQKQSELDSLRLKLGYNTSCTAGEQLAVVEAHWLEKEVEEIAGLVEKEEQELSEQKAVSEKYVQGMGCLINQAKSYSNLTDKEKDIFILLSFVIMPSLENRKKQLDQKLGARALTK